MTWYPCETRYFVFKTEAGNKTLGALDAFLKIHANAQKKGTNVVSTPF